MGILLGIVIAAIFYVWSRHQHTKEQSKVYPPGPKPIPVLGNILDLTPRELWHRATSWANEYGERHSACDFFGRKKLMGVR